jgi:pyruvate/2-oxoglutarate dehydrogenase complex dihydrolipoamide acyltransferase (E2) component
MAKGKRILKANHVASTGVSRTISGTANIAKPAAQGAPSKSAPQASPARPKGQPKAEIIAKEDGFVVIRVVCGCGEEVQLRCAYGQAKATPPQAPPTAQASPPAGPSPAAEQAAVVEKNPS